MIVYCVQRRWFVDKTTAETYRKNLGLKPAATLKVEVDGRDALASLLNTLCSPPIAGVAVTAPATPALVDSAYVDARLTVPDCVPLFLIKDDAQRKAVALDRFVRQVAP